MKKDISKMEWWEMLNWKEMGNTFEQLSPELQEKIRKANLI